MTGQQVLRLFAARRYAETGTGRQIRTAAELTLAEVAAAVGTTESTLSRWETNARAPRGDAARAWAALLSELQAAAKKAKTAA